MPPLKSFRISTRGFTRSLKIGVGIYESELLKPLSGHLRL